MLVEQNLRSGRWSKEEVTYALLLIQDFYDGIIQNAKVGITLCTLLADKLLCNPRRIADRFGDDDAYDGTIYSMQCIQIHRNYI